MRGQALPGRCHPVWEDGREIQGVNEHSFSPHVTHPLWLVLVPRKAGLFPMPSFRASYIIPAVCICLPA